MEEIKTEKYHIITEKLKSTASPDGEIHIFINDDLAGYIYIMKLEDGREYPVLALSPNAFGSIYLFNHKAIK
jgi:hypothetical protein